MNYLIEGNTLTIEKPISIAESLDFVQILRKNNINAIKLKCSISTVTMFFIKKYTKISATEWPTDMVNIFNKIVITRPETLKEKLQDKREWLLKTTSIFSVNPNNGLQDKFWRKIFLSIFSKVLIDNIFIILFLFFGIGISISFLLYYEFMKYGIQMESCKVALYSGVKVLCPMFTGFAIMAKSCTSLAVVINNMNAHGDFRIMSLMGLPPNRVFLSPMFFTLLISGPILNMLAIFGLIVGCALSWVLNGNNYRLFISILLAEMCWEYVIESSVRASLASLVYALGTCIGGTNARNSFDSSIRSINICVIIGTLGNIIAQILVSIAVTRD